MGKNFFDFDDDDFAMSISDNMEVDSEGNFMNTNILMPKRHLHSFVK